MSSLVGNVSRKVITPTRPFLKQTMKPPNPDAVAGALRKLLPRELPSSLDTSRPGNLYEVLSRHPDGGVGRRVTQCRWGPKGIEGSYWLVTRAKFKLEGKHGKAWGQLFWKGAYSFQMVYTYDMILICPLHVGQNVTKGKDERIRGSLKYTWVEGKSTPPKVAAEAKSLGSSLPPSP